MILELLIVAVTFYLISFVAGYIALSLYSIIRQMIW